MDTELKTITEKTDVICENNIEDIEISAVCEAEELSEEPKKKKAKRGFTLVELIVVIAIIAILAAIAIPAVLSIVEQARRAKIMTEASDLYSVCQAAITNVYVDDPEAFHNAQYVKC